jgi:hypothetical protein
VEVPAIVGRVASNGIVHFQVFADLVDLDSGLSKMAPLKIPETAATAFGTGRNGRSMPQYHTIVCKTQPKKHASGHFTAKDL